MKKKYKDRNRKLYVDNKYEKEVAQKIQKKSFAFRLGKENVAERKKEKKNERNKRKKGRKKERNKEKKQQKKEQNKRKKETMKKIKKEKKKGRKKNKGLFLKSRSNLFRKSYGTSQSLNQAEEKTSNKL